MPRNILNPRRLMTPKLGANSSLQHQSDAPSNRLGIVSFLLISLLWSYAQVEGKAGSVEGDFRGQSSSLCSTKVAFPSPQ